MRDLYRITFVWKQRFLSSCTHWKAKQEKLRQAAQYTLKETVCSNGDNALWWFLHAGKTCRNNNWYLKPRHWGFIPNSTLVHNGEGTVFQSSLFYVCPKRKCHHLYPCSAFGIPAECLWLSSSRNGTEVKTDSEHCPDTVFPLVLTETAPIDTTFY